MPIYNYQCSNCEFHINYYLAINERNREFECPICGQKLIKLIGEGKAFNFKGDGFYKKGWQ